LKRLQDNGLPVAAEKCVWRGKEVEFLGYVLSRGGVKMAQDKVEAVLRLKTPRSLTKVQSFLGFANFYQQFIQDYSRIAGLLMELTKKTKQWVWNSEAEVVFTELKQRFTMALILTHFDA